MTNPAYNMPLVPKTELGADYETNLRKEFNGYLDPRLRGVMISAAIWFRETYDRDLIYTCVNRSADQNKADGGAKYSAHLYGRALDIRANDLKQNEIDGLLKFIKDNWNTDDNWLYVIVHGAGSNRHIHINIRFDFTHGNFSQYE